MSELTGLPHAPDARTVACAKMGLVEFASACLVFGSRSEKRRNGERSNGHSQEQDERHHQALLWFLQRCPASTGDA
jgi:hypothetical protein